MIEMTLREIAHAVSGELFAENPDRVITGTTTTDSREIQPGDVFVAKPGEFTDGFLFIDPAVTAGATLVIAEKRSDATVDQIVVPNAVEALGKFASDVISRARRLGRLRIVGITGSNGKTTTKNLLRAILEPLGETVAPRASFNNEVGAPVTFLKVRESTDFLVAEMGASRVGDIRRLTQMAPPNIGVVLKVGMAHAGEFGGLDKTFIAKSEMVTGLTAQDVAVLNRDDSRVADMAKMTDARVCWFGVHPDAHVRASNIRVSLAGTDFDLHLPDGQSRTIHFSVLGEHHVHNALAAAASAHELGATIDDISRGLESVSMAEKGRMEVFQGRGITIIHDAYNASPDSMSAALKTLAQIRPEDGRTIAVLGHMSELGESEGEEHDRIGILAVRLRLSQIVAVGANARRLHISAINEGAWDGESVHLADNNAAFAYLTEYLQPGDVVLVKASNSAGLHALAERLGDWVT